MMLWTNKYVFFFVCFSSASDDTDYLTKLIPCTHLFNLRIKDFLDIFLMNI